MEVNLKFTSACLVASCLFEFVIKSKALPAVALSTVAFRLMAFKYVYTMFFPLYFTPNSHRALMDDVQ